MQMISEHTKPGIKVSAGTFHAHSHLCFPGIPAFYLIDTIFLLCPYIKHFYVFPSLMTGPAVLADVGEAEATLST